MNMTIRSLADIEKIYEYLIENLVLKEVMVKMFIDGVAQSTIRVKTSEDALRVRTFLENNWNSGRTYVTTSFPRSRAGGWFVSSQVE
jgi:hypothetical protein